MTDVDDIASTWAEDLRGAGAHGMVEHDLTDAGNAERVAQDHREELRYLLDHSTWIVLRGDRWVAVADAVALDYAVWSAEDHLEGLENQIRDGDFPFVSDDLRHLRRRHAFAVDSLNLNRLNAALELAKGPGHLGATVEDFDVLPSGVERDDDWRRP